MVKAASSRRVEAASRRSWQCKALCSRQKKTPHKSIDRVRRVVVVFLGVCREFYRVFGLFDTVKVKPR